MELDTEAWNGFLEMRRAIKKPMTERAIGMLMKRLEKMKANGHDVNACLDQSTLHCWRDVYPLKENEIPNLNRQYLSSVDAPMSAAEKARAREAADAFLAKHGGKLRRVA